jgi:ABC-2 type transport system permease protein
VARTITIYSLYFAQFLKARLAYRGDFFAAIGASALTALGGVLFVFVLMDGERVTDLKGWNRHEVLFIYGYSMLSMGIFAIFAPNLYRFGDRYVIEGQFDRVLLRPLNSLCQVLFESFNLESIGYILVGFVVMSTTSEPLAISYGLLDCVWLVVSAISGAVILLSVFIALASMSFHFEDRMGIAPPFYNMINFGRYPLPIYNRLLQFILQWVVPFGFVAFYPATHFFNREGFEFYCYFTPVMALICLTIASYAWQFGVSRYASTGN